MPAVFLFEKQLTFRLDTKVANQVTGLEFISINTTDDNLPAAHKKFGFHPPPANCKISDFMIFFDV